MQWPLRERLAQVPARPTWRSRSRCWRRRSRVRIDFDAAARYGASTAQLTRSLQALVDGEKVTQIVEGNHRFDLVVRLPEPARSLEGLAGLLIETPGGRIPLSKLASIEDADGPNQISPATRAATYRDFGQRPGRALSGVVADPARHGNRRSVCRGLLHHPGRAVPGAGGSQRT